MIIERARRPRETRHGGLNVKIIDVGRTTYRLHFTSKALKRVDPSYRHKSPRDQFKNSQIHLLLVALSKIQAGDIEDDNVRVEACDLIE